MVATGPEALYDCVTHGVCADRRRRGIRWRKGKISWRPASNYRGATTVRPYGRGDDEFGCCIDTGALAGDQDVLAQAPQAGYDEGRADARIAAPEPH